MLLFFQDEAYRQERRMRALTERRPFFVTFSYFFVPSTFCQRVDDGWTRSSRTTFLRPFFVLFHSCLPHISSSICRVPELLFLIFLHHTHPPTMSVHSFFTLTNAFASTSFLTPLSLSAVNSPASFFFFFSTYSHSPIHTFSSSFINHHSRFPLFVCLSVSFCTVQAPRFIFFLLFFIFRVIFQSSVPLFSLHYFPSFFFSSPKKKDLVKVFFYLHL
ncbi:MAG: hypothetical protein J3R72DRAFT_64864 [Linnemannia gamsii]|nr:MAG: hypothetical protein J3R72DRAFT_64864 [Linnemannia gamsii]